MILHTNKMIEAFIDGEQEPLNDPIYGDGYRCSVDLKDGTHLPCVIIRRNDRYLDLAIRRFDEERSGKGALKSASDPYREIIKNFLTGKNSVSFHEIKTIRKSRYAIPRRVLDQVEGETAMGWTGFVLEMSDGAAFSYGTAFAVEFFDVPEGYGFDDVAKVHCHSYVGQSGEIVNMRSDPERTNLDFKVAEVLREKPFFVCYVDQP